MPAEKELPILPRLLNKVETMRSVNESIKETIGRLNRSIGDETETASKLEPMPKKDPGEFEKLEISLHSLSIEMEISLKALNSFANRTVSPPKAPNP